MIGALRGVALVLALAITACAAIGEPFDTTHVAELSQGEQTLTEVRAWFGEPHHVSPALPHEAPCVERWHYGHAEATPDGTTASDILVVSFDAEDRICEVAYSRSR